MAAPQDDGADTAGIPAPEPALARRLKAPPELLAVLHVLDRVEGGHEAAYIIARAARRAELDPARHARVVDLVYGVLRSLNRLDHNIAAVTGAPPTSIDPWRLQVLRVAALLGERAASVNGLVAWIPLGATEPHEADRLAAAARDVAGHARRALDGPRVAGTDALALATGHPAWFVGIVRRLLPQEAEGLLEANNEDPPLVLRTNPLKTTREALATRLWHEGFRAMPTTLSPLGLAVSPKQGIFRTHAFRDGWFEVQDEGSQLVGLLVGARPGEAVLDACAGAGGKTLLLGAEMHNKGTLVALDVHAGRLLDLKRRAARAGVQNQQAYLIDADGNVLGGARALRRGDATPIAHLPRESFDRVLVDAPCSGLGTLRRTPELRWRHGPQDIAEYPPRQLAILSRWAERVQPGGRVVYATCTITPEENEDVVAKFLGAHPDFRLVRADGALPKETPSAGLADGSGFLRLWPHRHGTEAFFAAVLERAPSAALAERVHHAPP